MKIKETLHFKRVLVDGEEGESIGDVLRGMADVVDNLSLRNRGQVVGVELRVDVSPMMGVVHFRLEDDVQPED